MKVKFDSPAMPSSTNSWNIHQNSSPQPKNIKPVFTPKVLQGQGVQILPLLYQITVFSCIEWTQFEIQELEIFDLDCWGILNPWILNDKFQIMIRP